MLLSPASTSASLPSSLWGKIKGGGGGPKSNKDVDLRERQQHMALARQRLLTLSFGDMETVRMLPSSFGDLEALARDWAKPPPDAIFSLRVPVEYASLHAARLVSGPYIYLTGEDSYQIAIMGVQGLRVEIVSDAPPPPEEEPRPPTPPPPPVLEMPAVFSLELQPGQTVALETTVASDGDLDMARMEDGTMVEGAFWGKLNIVHQGDTHKMEFSGTRLPPQEEVAPTAAITNGQSITDLVVNTKALTRLAVVAKPATAKCHLSLLPPAQQYCDVYLTFSQFWKMGLTWPPAETVEDNKIKYFLRVHPGGAMEHFESMMVATSIYYEAIPDADLLDPMELLAPRNSYAMPFRDFVGHLQDVLDKLGLTMHTRSNFINNNLALFANHRNIAYRLLSPSRIAAAIDISVTAESCLFNRLFLMFRGISDDDLINWSGAGEKEANNVNWRDIIGFPETTEPGVFRVLETSVLELT
ncbi:hypothetical protein GLOTRDRAFT_56560 [Gloeophyllum trabeum ATCC 11539]|uniref:Uncharacterized protein n=1 Tax=Gloeophyllum trabeum (strain ATCC 11539 / FP-39264 / Madison 617) TaxID=670483 RepID=S7QDZ8_GLOTA|nr:uncharacterized protein GLOTRDRAFT_56560 [Gloeophyllum trabeum ATCC 11539]EPQ58016.1 hypothetical protein GLOTRDRAFT_56560 [Gloeophyllum trabeum ATCC 11539]